MILMKCILILPETTVSTEWFRFFTRATRNIALGSDSFTIASTRIGSSLAITPLKQAPYRSGYYRERGRRSQEERNQIGVTSAPFRRHGFGVTNFAEPGPAPCVQTSGATKVRENAMKQLRLAIALGLLALVFAPRAADPACCYFSAKDQDVNQPAQKAFITWDAEEEVVSWTVQPKFEGNAVDFGMVIPTPTQPKLDEMPRDFFKELAVFTILKPMDLEKYKQKLVQFGGGLARGEKGHP